MKNIHDRNGIPAISGEQSNAAMHKRGPLCRVIRPVALAWFAAGFAATAAEKPVLITEGYRRPNTGISAEATATDDANTLALGLNHVFRPSERTIVVTQVSAMKGDEEFGIFSAGAGVRRLLGDSKTFIGANVFFDALKDTDGFSYSQIGFGGEVSRGRLTLRGNYYLPVGNRSDAFTRQINHGAGKTVTGVDATGRSFTATATKSFTETIETRREAMQGWDVELEVAIFEEPQFFDPVLALGYYSVSDGDLDYSGLKVRGALRIGEHVTLGIEWREDAGDIGQEWRATVRFDYLLGGESAPTAAAGLPSVAAGDGKTMRPLEKSDGKAARPLDGKTAHPVAPALPRNFFDPVRRTPWPNVALRSTSSFSDPKLSQPIVIFGPSVPVDDCCDSGGPLIFP